MPEDPIGRLVEHIIQLERVANTVARESQQRIKDLFTEIAADLREIDPTSPPQATYRRLRTEQFLEQAQDRFRDFSEAERRALQSRLAVIGRQEAKFAERTLIATLGTEAADRVRNTPITQQRMRAILNSEPFRGRLLGEHMDRISANAYARTRDAVRLGMTNEESIPDIARRVRGRQAGFIRQDPQTGAFVPKGTPGAKVKPRFVGGALSTTTREAEALVRTAVNHVSNEGMMGTFRENETILKGVRYSSFLDSRTSEICLSLDGSTWPVDSDEIRRPPQHFNCRSVLVPEPDWERLGLEPPPEPTRAVRDLSSVSEEDLRRKVSARRRTGDFGDVDQIPSSTSASVWLQRQPKRAQAKLLGARKAELFRKGEISLGDLVRQDNTTVPLSELET